MIESRCGLLCKECRFYLKQECRGCTAIENPFWGACPVKGCAEGKKLEHCGACGEFSCELLKSFSYAEEEGDNGQRIEQCRIWSKT